MEKILNIIVQRYFLARGVDGHTIEKYSKGVLNIVSDNCYYTTNTPHPPEIGCGLFILYAREGGTGFANRLSDVPRDSVYIISCVLEGEGYILETPVFFDLTAKLTSQETLSGEIRADISRRYFDKVAYMTSDEIDKLYDFLSLMQANPWEKLMELAVQIHLGKYVRRKFIRPRLVCGHV
jgi:hypothetical protein